jgi:hypothetical protein
MMAKTPEAMASRSRMDRETSFLSGLVVMAWRVIRWRGVRSDH